MSTRGRIRKVIYVTGGSAALTYGLYKIFLPKDEDLKKIAEEVLVEEQDETFVGSGTAVGYDTRSREFHRMVDLSQRGYSFSAARKIITSEKQAKYKKLYEQEREERLKIIKEQKLQKQKEEELKHRYEIDRIAGLTSEFILGLPKFSDDD